jgi:hypothetical protein
MYNSAGRKLTVACGFLLLAAVLLASVGGFVGGASARRAFTGSLRDLLPTAAETAGWSVESRPVAETAEMKRAVSEQLNYDDAVYYIYTRGELKISVYIAYWTPGKMPARLISTHTPDICWVMVGWKRLAAVSGRILALPTGAKSVPAEKREMQINGKSEWVLFWHLFAGTGKSYGTAHLPSWYAALRDVWLWGLNQRAEQFFVRISANAPVDDWWNTPIVAHVAPRLLTDNTLALRRVTLGSGQSLGLNCRW